MISQVLLKKVHVFQASWAVPPFATTCSMEPTKSTFAKKNVVLS